MQTTQERSIDGLRVVVTQLPARRALKALNRVGKVLGGPFASLAASVGAKSADVDLSKLGEALQKLFANLEDNDLDFFIDTFLETATVDNKPARATLDLVFQGRVDSLLRVLLFALEVNYQNFFHVLKGLSANTAPTLTH